MKKTFDCVAMKRRGAEAVQAQLAGLTFDEQVAFWAEQGRLLRERQAQLRRALAAREPNPPRTGSRPTPGPG